MPIGTVEWIEQGMLVGPLANVTDHRTGQPSGFRFGLRNQFFHGSHPLGWIRKLYVVLDGEAAPDDAVHLVIHGQSLPASQVPAIKDVWWQPLEVVDVEVDRAGGLDAGEHTLLCGLDLSTFFFTPEIDRQDVYPTMSLRLEARLPVASVSQGVYE